MKAEDLYDGIGTMDEDLLERSERNAEKKKKVRRIRPRMAALIAAAALLLVGGIALMTYGVLHNRSNDPADEENGKKQGQFLLAGAVLPKLGKEPQMENYPDTEKGMQQFREAHKQWKEEKEALMTAIEEYGEDKAYGAVEQFTLRSLKTMLSGRNGENSAYSPINIYLLLGMLAESTDGASRAQILSLAGAESIEDIRARSKALWNALYFNSDDEKLVLGASVWLDAKAKNVYNEETLARLASDYYASSFAGEMGSAEYNKEFRGWFNKMTDGMLKDRVEELELNDDTIIALATTICFINQWANPFDESDTTEEVFHAATGDVKAKFMHETAVGLYYRGERFTAVYKYLRNSRMWMILPDEGVSVDEILDDPELEKLLDYRKDNMTEAMIHLGVPKFDVVGDTDLLETLPKLGVTDIFNLNADFSPLLNGSGSFVSEAKHSARVQIDEKGVKAAAFAEVQLSRGILPTPDGELYITLDRPFLFMVTGLGETPLFAGVVEKP